MGGRILKKSILVAREDIRHRSKPVSGKWHSRYWGRQIC